MKKKKTCSLKWTDHVEQDYQQQTNKVSVGYTFLVAMHLHVAISCLKFW